MASTLSPTLFYDLTLPKQGVERTPYPATDLIYKLLHHTGADVSSFRRNCQVSYRLVEYARDLYDEINSRIREAESSGSWESYDAYYRAIDPLEEVLLSIMGVTEVEREEYLIDSTPPDLVDQSIEAWINRSISDWQERRDSIRKHLEDLRSREGLKECISATSHTVDIEPYLFDIQDFIPSPEDYQNEIDSAKTHDDRTLLQNLLKSIGDNESKVERGKSQNSQMVRDMKDKLQSALDFLKGDHKRPLEEELTVLAIKCAMTTFGVTELMKNDEVKTKPALYGRLYGGKIWKTAQALASNIHEHLRRDNEAANLAELGKIYAELQAALTGDEPILMPDGYLKLFPLVGRIGRAYHAQALVLASLCRQVATHFEKNTSYETREALEKALDKTVAAFTAAGGLNNKPAVNGTEHPVNGDLTNGISTGAIPNISGDYDGSCEPLFDESIEEIKSCYGAMQLGDGSDLQKQLEAARIKDQERLQSYQARLKQFIPARELVDLTLLVHNSDISDSPFHKLHAKVLRSARLSYIKWLVTKELKGYEIIHFKDNIQKQTMDLDDKIESLVEDNKCTLNLVVQKEEQK